MKLTKEQKTELTAMIKDTVRANNLKAKQNSIFFKKDDFLCVYDYYIGAESYIFKLRVKKYAYDDILWDILGMSENSKQPLSLRAVGAFAIYGIVTASFNVPYDEEGRYLEYIRTFLNGLDYGFDVYLSTSNIVDSINAEAGRGYQNDELMCLEYIYSGDTKKALRKANECIASGIKSCFSNEGKDFFERIVEKYS